MSFFRDELIDFALDHETETHIAAQREWILREPANAVPYYNLAQLYRMSQKGEQARGLLLEAVRLRPDYGAAHAALSQIYAVRGEYQAAWRHAREAESAGDTAAVELLRRYGVAEPRPNS